MLVADAAGVTGRLVVDLVEGGPETNSAADLLKTGFLVWFYTIIAFAFLYWVLDGGGPESRFLAPPQFPDLAFPEQLNPNASGLRPNGWGLVPFVVALCDRYWLQACCSGFLRDG